MSDIKKIEQEDSASTFVDAIPDYKLADLIFVLKTTARDSQAFQSASSALFTAIKEQKLAPLYYFIHNSSETANLLPWDESLYNDIFLQNEKHLIELKDAIKKLKKKKKSFQFLKAGINWGIIMLKLETRIRLYQHFDMLKIYLQEQETKLI